jgi:hypothetical protein
MNAYFVDDSPVHSISLGAYNTWSNWHLFPTTRPLVAPPKPVTKLEKVKGFNGYLDYTKVLSSSMTFEDREGSWEFRVIETSANSWKTVFNDIVSKLDGKYFDSIVLQDEPTYKYRGRVTINSWKNNQQQTIIQINYRLNPYKRLVNSTTKDWLWDELDLTSNVDDIFYTSFNVKGYAYKSIINPNSHAVSADLNCSAACNVGNQRLVAGMNKGALTLQPGVNQFYFTGNSTIGLSYIMDEEVL